MSGPELCEYAQGDASYGAALVLDNELRRHRSAETQRERRGAIELFVCEFPHRVGVLRSVLAERFRLYLGEPPMTYLSRSRFQLGARMLASTSYNIARISGDVGYESEPAFNRAFKRHFGAPPAKFRIRAKSARAAQRAAR